MDKDLFSDHSPIYKAFRPLYPEALYDFIFSLVRSKDAAWDCGTGNGQVAHRLAKNFKRVAATDISQRQIDEATAAPNISYSVCRAEKTNFPEDIFDLITVAQALHWFDQEAFYREVRRVGRQSSVLAVWGYGNIITDEPVLTHVRDFYSNRVGQYWDDARIHVETGYRHLPFPFPEIEAPSFHIRAEWTGSHLAGYLRSWSATQRCIAATKHDPVPTVVDTLAKEGITPSSKISVSFPVFLKVGRVN